MNNKPLHSVLPTEQQQLKSRLRHLLGNENLQDQRTLLATLAAELAVDVLDCGAALLHIMQQDGYPSSLSSADTPNAMSSTSTRIDARVMTICIAQPNAQACLAEPVLPFTSVTPTIKMLRYRLDIGKKHQLTVKDLKKVLVEESGVDINNINNVMIHGQYTLIELPDEMPQDIFQHLKTVEINQQKLNIKRLKSRTKKQANNRFRHGKPRTSQRSGDDSV
ncbi:DbpA RNA binding domain-containing protein [Crenothrix sp.]|uniref:DbpA RNA binding domain-containing protein n=1 Tax=Crenothrix sp. TaxID=3100433 RepID=UPI00374C9D85